MDEFGGSSGLRAPRRRFKTSEPLKIPASSGVRLGYVADVDRPPPPGVMPKRKARRIPASFYVRLSGGEWRRVSGDVSAGGVLVLASEQLSGLVEIWIQLSEGQGSWQASGEVVRHEMRGARHAHHVRFLEPDRLRELGELVERSVASGETRLATE